MDMKHETNHFKKKKNNIKIIFLHTYTTPLLLSAAVLAPALTFFDCNDN